MLVKTRAGFTLLEMLVVLGILGIFFALGIPMLRPPSSYLLANDLKAMVQQARFEAIKRNTPVAVVWNSTTRTFVTRFDQTNTTFAAPGSACTNTTPEGLLNTKRLDDYRNISVTTNMSGNGVVWLPTGLNRSCGGGVGNSTTTIGDGSNSYNVVISVSGRVRIEKV